MTIFHSEVGAPMLRVTFATWDDWHGELQAVTSYYWEEFKMLHRRICTLPMQGSPTSTKQRSRLLQSNCSGMQP